MNNPSQGTSVPSVFSFESKQLRAIVIDGEPWFVAADVCAILGISNTSMALRALDDDEKGISLIDTPSGEQQMLIVNDSGLYTLMLRCRDAVKPGSLPHRFRKKVTSEILPAIRRTGQYETAPLTPQQALRRLLTQTRWVVYSEDDDILCKPLHEEAFIVTPARLVDVLRETEDVPVSSLPDIICACAERLKVASQSRRVASDPLA